MLERNCKQLGLKYCGVWKDTGLLIFVIDNPKMVSNGASFAIANAARTDLIDAMNVVETRWINHKIKMDKEVNNNV